jgi:hypothetical protein
MKRILACTVLATLTALSGGCGGAVKTTKVMAPGTKPVMLSATREQLLGIYDATASTVRSVNATLELKPTAGSAYSGIIEEYHEVKAFLLAQRPASIRVVGQAPVIGSTVFDMASDGDTFRVFIPSKQKFLTGSVALERSSKKPIENLRPQHLLDALLWPEITAQDTVLLEEFNDETGRYYILTVLRGPETPEIARKIWFNRADLQVARLVTYGPGGMLLSEVYVSDWQPLAAPGAPAPGPGSPAAFPRAIRIVRPHDDYRLDLQITKLALNESLPADRFQLAQPEGTELVRVGETPEEKKP